MGGGVGRGGGSGGGSGDNVMMTTAGGQLNNSTGMRRTSLGFMPYLPTSNVGSRRDSMGSIFSGIGNSMENDGNV